MPIQPQEFLTKAGVIEESAKCALFAQVVSHYGKAKLKALGTSMVPAIWPGDTLVVERREALELLAGEVAVYLHQGRLFAHRVIRVAHEPEVFLVTRGDATAGDDPPVLPEEVIGRVVTIVPGPRLAYRVRRAIGALRHALVIRSRRVSP